MRSSLSAASSVLLVAAAFCLSGCAKEREYTQPSRSPAQAAESPVQPDAGPDAGEGPWEVDPAELDLDAGFPSMEPFVDAGRPRDAGTADASRPDAAVRDAAGDAQVDAGLPPWETATGEQRGQINLEGACPTPAPAPATPDPSCRTWPWHTPPCAHVPVECAALHESTYCVSLSDYGSPKFTGLDTGASCSGVYQPAYPIAAANGSFAVFGGDVITTDFGVVLKHSMVDGSFDVASVPSRSVFVQGDKLLVHQLVDGIVVRYASWEDLKSGTNGAQIARATPQTGAVFGASSNAIVAAWPRGQVDILSAADTRRSFHLQGFDPVTDGPMLGVDLSDDEKQVYIVNVVGIWTFDATTGALLRRRVAPDLQGLSCERGLPLGAAPPNLAGSARPGYYFADREATAILASDDCDGPFSGPRFFGQTPGPELLMIASYFSDTNSVKDTRVAPHSLVLTSVQTTAWNISVADNSGLERIIVNGGGSQLAVQSKRSIPVETLVDGDSVALGTHPGEWPTLGEAQLRSNIESHTGRKVTEILGCHFGSNFVVRDVPPLCAGL